MRGKCSSMLNRVVRSTSVPIAELPRQGPRDPKLHCEPDTSGLTLTESAGWPETAICISAPTFMLTI